MCRVSVRLPCMTAPDHLLPCCLPAELDPFTLWLCRLRCCAASCYAWCTARSSQRTQSSRWAARLGLRVVPHVAAATCCSRCTVFRSALRTCHRSSPRSHPSSLLRPCLPLPPTRPQDPCLTLVLRDVICPTCQDCQDLDMCRDPAVS